MFLVHRPNADVDHLRWRMWMQVKTEALRMYTARRVKGRRVALDGDRWHIPKLEMVRGECQ